MCKVDINRNSFPNYRRLKIGRLVPLRKGEPVLKSLRGLCMLTCLRGWSTLPWLCRVETVSRLKSRTCWSMDKLSTCGDTGPAEVWEAELTYLLSPYSPLHRPHRTKGGHSAPPRVRCMHTPSITINLRIRNTMHTHPQHAQNQCHQYPERGYRKSKTKQTYSESKYSKQQGLNQTHHKVNKSETSSSVGTL